MKNCKKILASNFYVKKPVSKIGPIGIQGCLSLGFSRFWDFLRNQNVEKI